MEQKKEVYGNSSISKLNGADRVRLRPAVIFGSDGLDGCEHSVFEIVSNSIDETREGHGKQIIVTRFADGSIEVEDFGRGIPMEFNPKENCYNWELVYCEMYAGGKYNNQKGQSYEYSLGTNGLGACATQYASEYMDVTVYANHFKYSLHFEKGENIGGLTKEPYSGKRTGTIQRWKPDLAVFTDTNIPLDYYTDMLKRQAVVNPGITFLLRNEVNGKMEETTYMYPNGISDYVAEIVGTQGLASIQSWSAERQARDRDDKPEYSLKMNFALTFSNRIAQIEYYHNSSWLEHGGAPEKAVMSAFVSEFDAYLRQQNKYNKTESKIKFADIQDCLILVSSSFSNVTSYETQTKKAITNKGIQEAMTEFLRHQLEVYFIENPLEAEAVAAQVLINKRSREDAEKSRLNMKKKLSGTIDITNRVEKFVDCRSKSPEQRELFIVEGDSALGACKLARDAEFQAIMPLRGKILNCLKADYDRIFKSDVITDLLRVLGCGVEVTAKANKNLPVFDLGNLHWSKIIICTDADVDGFSIRTLVLTMIYRLIPTLLREGKVFIAESPLYEITSKNETYFAYTEREKADFLAQLGSSEKYTIQRSKGLGENEPDMMNLTTMNPASRRLIQVLPAQAEQTAEIFELLLGNNLEGRKQYISDNGYQYMDLTDIS